jgi:undecaprenyl-diphosphatase
MFSFLDAIILGIVEGITEFLPVSSTGHLILTSTILRIPDIEFVKSFEIFIQLGAILAVLILYSKKVFTSFEIIKKVAVAFIPTGTIGLLLYKFIKTYLLGNTNVVLLSLLIGGIAITAFEGWYKDHQVEAGIQNISYKHAVLIGIFQGFAVIPGVSRSAATIVGGLLLGYDRKTIVEFSFILAVPTMLAATGLDIIKNPDVLSSGHISVLLVGFAVAFFTALAAVKWLLRYIQRNTFTAFGYYRIAVAVLAFLLI